MTPEELAAIHARVENMAEVRAAGPDNFAGMEPEQLRSIAMAYAQDVPALLDRIAELERQHAAAMAIVRAVAGARLVSTDFGWCLCSDVSMEAAGEWREQARALLAGETREETGE